MSSSLHTFRFPRSSRLKSPSVIRRVFRDGSQLRAGMYSIHWQHNPSATPDGTPPARFAVVVAKRLGKAHARNRIKRRLREAMRLSRDRWPAGVDVVVRANESRIAAMEFAALQQKIEDSLRKIAANQR